MTFHFDTTHSSKVLPPPAALVSTKQMALDPRAEPRYGERVPYVVVYGGPSSRLADLVIAPHQLLADRFNNITYNALLFTIY